ncbi:MAG TPA: hypothetical protein DIS88_00240 [Prevotella sp.]|nr:hypothetical protein [Prevotella sp.]
MGVKEKFNMILHAFVSERTTGRLGQMQLMMFLVASGMKILGLPFHFLFNWVGNDGMVQRYTSITIWLCAIVILGLYLKKQLRLETAFLSLAVYSQVLISFRILYLTLACTPEQQSLRHELVIMNEALTFSNFLIPCIGMVRKAPSWVLSLFIGTIAIAYIINPAVVGSQFLLLFTFVMVCVWGYAILMRSIYNKTSREINDYEQLQDSILDMFNMSKMEMVSLIQLCRQTGHNPSIDQKVVKKLSEQTRHNLISLGEFLRNERRDKVIDLSDALPQLSPTEVEVCRLVLKGMTQNEIAIAMNKSMSNIGTVRGNIRKKLQLEPNEDLHEVLLMLTTKSGPAASAPPLA